MATTPTHLEQRACDRLAEALDSITEAARRDDPGRARAVAPGSCHLARSAGLRDRLSEPDTLQPIGWGSPRGYPLDPSAVKPIGRRPSVGKIVR